MAMDATSISYLETLKDKYSAALKDEREALEALEGARRRKSVYGDTLSEEGVDVAALASANGNVLRYTITAGRRVQALFDPDYIAPSNGLRVDPLSDTHAVYILMRKYGNVGFTIGELKKYGDLEGYDLTEKTIKNTFWKQLNQGRMERVDGGKIRLTKEGETFNKFRPPKST
jgi:hypothetical protein